MLSLLWLPGLIRDDTIIKKRSVNLCGIELREKVIQESYPVNLNVVFRVCSEIDLIREGRDGQRAVNGECVCGIIRERVKHCIWKRHRCCDEIDGFRLELSGCNS